MRACLATDAGVVTHALEVVGDAVEREQEAQVACHRLLRGDGQRDEVGHLALHGVDVAVVLDDPRGGIGVVLLEGLDGGDDALGHEAAHAQDVVLDLALLGLERPARVGPGDLDRGVHIEIGSVALRLVLARRRHGVGGWGVRWGRSWLPPHPKRPET